MHSIQPRKLKLLVPLYWENKQTRLPYLCQVMMTSLVWNLCHIGEQGKCSQHCTKPAPLLRILIYNCVVFFNLQFYIIWEMTCACAPHPPIFNVGICSWGSSCKISHHILPGKSNIDKGEVVISKWCYLPNTFVHDCSYRTCIKLKLFFLILVGSNCGGCRGNCPSCADDS